MYKNYDYDRKYNRQYDKPQKKENPNYYPINYTTEPISKETPTNIKYNEENKKANPIISVLEISTKEGQYSLICRLNDTYEDILTSSKLFCGKHQLPSYLIDPLSFKLESLANERKARLQESGQIINFSLQMPSFPNYMGIPMNTPNIIQPPQLYDSITPYTK